MELAKIIEIMRTPEKIIEPGQCNIISSYVGGFISHYEEQLNEENYQVSVKWGELRKELKTNSEADRAIEMTEIYRQREKTKLLIGQLKRFRGDLRDRFAVITSLKRY